MRDGRIPEKRIRLVQVSTGVALALLVSGITLIGVSIEPNSDYVLPEPWLVVLAPNRIGVEFVTYGRDASAVQYVVVDSRGNWIVGPTPVTPRYGYSVSPSGAVAVSDSGMRVHIAWTLSDSNLHRQSFHYVQLDAFGRVMATAGPLGDRPAPAQSYAPYSPGIQVNPSTVEVVWTDQGTSWAATLDLNGRLVQPAHPSSRNVTGPPRVPPPLPSALGGSASVGSDGAGSTYYVWQNSTYRRAGRESILEYDVSFYRTGPGGAIDRMLYSTDDWFWTTKPMFAPGFVLALAGAVTLPILARYLVSFRRLRGRP